MTTKEYLLQAYRLDKIISSDLEEVKALQEIISGVSSVQLSERIQVTKNCDASFVKAVEKIMDLEQRINKEVEKLTSLKKEIRGIIIALDDRDEQMVLKYRYIHNYTWAQIASELDVDERTVRRWHSKALQHISIPQNTVKT